MFKMASRSEKEQINAHVEGMMDLPRTGWKTMTRSALSWKRDEEKRRADPARKKRIAEIEN